MAFHSFKQGVKKILPAAWVSWIIRQRGEKMKPLDLSYLEMIRKATTVELKNEFFLENNLLPSLGINNERLEEFPATLYPYTGFGLHYWQYPIQFAPYLVKLSQFPIHSYLEIGTRHGGTFMITVEFLEKFNGPIRATGVDLGYAPAIVKYSQEKTGTRFLQADSGGEVFKSYLQQHPHFDLAFIDGNHEEWACRADVELLRDKCNILVLHDIASDVCPGVKIIWSELKAVGKNEFDFYEFTSQYGLANAYLGIGMAVRKKFIAGRK
jgi:hypothetical protein